MKGRPPSLEVHVDHEPQDHRVGGAVEALEENHTVGATHSLSLPVQSAEAAILIDSVLSLGECRALIVAAEVTGFHQTLVNEGRGHKVLDRDIRNSGRCIIKDTAFVAALFERVRARLPPRWVDGKGDPWRLVGLNERLRLLRYKVGQSFAPYMDESFVRGGEFEERVGERSFMTAMIYLNDGDDASASDKVSDEQEFWGGRLRFVGFAPDGSARESAFSVPPRAGRLLAFEHTLLHEGEPVRRGVKYALRTDVMFAREEGSLGGVAADAAAFAAASMAAEKAEVGHVADASIEAMVGVVMEAASPVVEAAKLAPPASPAGSASRSSFLGALPGAAYHSRLFASSAKHLFEEASILPFPVRNRGITRAPGAPRLCTFSVSACGLLDGDGDPLPPLLVHVVRTLVESGALRRMPKQISINHYHDPGYCMVPHKDGYADQAAIVSLGAASSLEFWHVPMTAEDKIARQAMHAHVSGTGVFAECLTRPSDVSIWMEPGSVLVLERLALDDYVHGLRTSESDVFVTPPADSLHANSTLVELDGLRARALAATRQAASDPIQPVDVTALPTARLAVTSSSQGAGDTRTTKHKSAVEDLTHSSGGGASVRMPRQPRVSIVLWTEFTPAPQ